MKKIKRGLSSVFNSPGLLYMGNLILASIGILIVFIAICLLITKFPIILSIVMAIGNVVKWIVYGLFFILGIFAALSTIVAIYHAIKLGVIWLDHKIKG